MKHSLLRRLPALALALVMSASLCVSPAWAAAGPQPEFDQRLIVLTDETSKNEKPLTLTGLMEGDKVVWTATNGITVEGDSTYTVDSIPAPSDGGSPSSTVTVSAKSSPAQGEISAQVTRDGETLTPTYRCYVYCGTAPLFVANEPLTGLTAPGNMDIIITITEHSELNYDITFSSSNVNIATVEQKARKISNTEYRATLTGVSVGQVIITMSLQGYSKPLTVEVTAAPGITPVTDVIVSPNILKNLNVGEVRTLTATVIPEDATNKTVTWKSSNDKVATVDQTGKVTAVGAGDAEITATADGKSGKCAVSVKTPPSTMTLTPTNLILDLKTGNIIPTGTITPELSGVNSTNNVKIDWTSSNASIVDFGVPGRNTTTTNSTDGNRGAVTIYGRKTGNVTISAKATFVDGDGKVTATVSSAYPCTVTVIDDNSDLITAMTLSEDRHSVPVNGTFKLSVTSYTPSNPATKGVTWRSSNQSIATVAPDGTVTGIAPGQVAITAVADYGGAVSSPCTVTVTRETETITLSFAYDSNSPAGSNKYAYAFKGTGNDYFPVTAVLSPEDGIYSPADPIRWASTNISVATVSGGTGTKATVTAVGPGETKITAIPMDHTGKDRILSAGAAEITVTVPGVTITNDSGNTLSSLTLMQDRRQTVLARAWGSAYNGNHSVEWTSSDPAIVSVTPKSGESAVLNARAPGTITLNARKGNFVTTLKVTVTEDSVGLIEASTPASTAYQFSKLASQLQAACSSKTGSSLSYITNLSVSSTDQGVLYDQHYSSEDTGAGVGLQDRYYPGTAPQGQRSLNDLSFVPKNTFTGTAEISYIAWSANNQSFPGVIRIAVNGTGDVAYSSGDGSPVAFSAEDFNFYHPNLRSVSFTLPQSNVGVLYYNYNSVSQPGTKVTATDTYSRSGNPSLDRVTFVPAAGYSGTVKISYKGTDTSGRSFTGIVTITVNEPSNAGSNTTDIYYDFSQDGWVTFRAADFSAACRYTLGEALSYVRFTPPPSADGTLFYNYRGFSDYDSMVTSTTSYYYAGTPALSGVSFVPISTTPGQVEIAYTGYTTRGSTFTGTVHIGQKGDTQQSTKPYYTVVTGQSVYLRASDFNTLCVNTTGATLSYVQFTQLPTVSQGTLRYTKGNSSTPNNVTTNTRFFYTGTGTASELIGNVYFQAGSSLVTVTIPFIGYNANGVSFTDEITIQITPPTSSYSGTNSSPFHLSAAQISAAVSGSLSGTLSYITFTTLPSATAGRLYSGYNGFGTGTQVSAGTQYYASGSPGIDQLSFVPRGRYSGQVTISYTATNTAGQSVSGQLVFTVSNNGNSKHFDDMAYYTWAGPSVDYLYENGVVNGITNTSYGPEMQIRRGDFVLMLVRALKFTGSGGYSFPDVPTGEYFAEAVAIAKQKGIVNGDNGYFRPYDSITRQDAMVIIKNAMAASGRNLGSASGSALNNFPDGSSVAGYARDAVSTLVQLGAVTGSDGWLLPYNSITRAEAAVILHFVMTM